MSLMRLGLLLASTLSLLGQSPVGNFEGELQTPSTKLRIGLTITAAKDGTYASELISFSQGNAKMAASTTTIEGKSVKLAIAAAGASYEGTFSEDSQTITGKFTQGLPFDLVFKRVAEFAKPNRPQEPKPPFSYLSEDVSFAGATAEILMAGTITTPKSEGKFPAVILVSGSGPQNRDEELVGHKPFLVWADALTKSGFAVLRYDDRGTYKSTGTFKGATSQDFALDTAAAVAYLKTRKDIDPKRIVVMGHSEGGIIAPIVASKDPSLAGIVLLAGPGVSGERIIEKQIPDMGRAAGLSEQQVKLSTEGGLQRVKQEMAKDAWLANFWTYDPAPTLEKVLCPVLAINGELDKQVDATVNLGAIEAALKKGGNKTYTVRVLPKLNHLLQTATTGSSQEYGQIEETVAPIALEEVIQWLKKLPATK